MNPCWQDLADSHNLTPLVDAVGLLMWPGVCVCAFVRVCAHLCLRLCLWSACAVACVYVSVFVPVCLYVCESVFVSVLACL